MNTCWISRNTHTPTLEETVERDRWMLLTMRGGAVAGYCQSVALPSISPNVSSPPLLLSVDRKRLRFRCSVSVANVVVVDDDADGVRSLIRPPRRLILLRHADSSGEDRSLRDHDRPISKGGGNDAAGVTHKLQKMGWTPELILSSDAARTQETLRIMRDSEPEFSKAEVHFMPSFYSVAAMDGQTAEHLQQAICRYSSDEILTVMCMGHNKGWEEAASMFCGASIKLDTCNAALLESKGCSWDETFTSTGLGGWKLHCIVKPDTMSH